MQALNACTAQRPGQALRMDSENAETLSSYAIFLDDRVKDRRRAEQMYLRAISAAPGEAAHLYNLAVFLEESKRDMEQADDYFQRALELEPDNGEINLAYAEFLDQHTKNRKGAKVHYARAAAALNEDERQEARRATGHEDKKQKKKNKAHPPRAGDREPLMANRSGQAADRAPPLGRQDSDEPDSPEEEEAGGGERNVPPPEAGSTRKNKRRQLDAMLESVRGAEASARGARARPSSKGCCVS